MSLQQGSVLVVDDELSLRKVLRTSLAGSGFPVEEARNGEEALGTVRGHPFDLVLLDINMPGISGIDACRKIRGMSPHAGIVMVSVRDGADDKVRAFDPGGARLRDKTVQCARTDRAPARSSAADSSGKVRA